MKSKKPWPTKAAMQQIYQENLWGTNHSKFYSGEGSHHPKIVKPYLKVVQEFLSSFDTLPSILDLGCGDFNIGSQLVKYSQKFIAVDIVPELITYNKANFHFDNLEFQCLDIVKDELPKVDIVILRQVIQHLSNEEIQEILPKLYTYKYIVLTEHIPNENFEPNKNIISGQGIRLKKQSGIDILKSPFNFKIKCKEEVLSIDLNSKQGRIVTCILEI